MYQCDSFAVQVYTLTCLSKYPSCIHSFSYDYIPCPHNISLFFVLFFVYGGTWLLTLFIGGQDRTTAKQPAVLRCYCTEEMFVLDKHTYMSKLQYDTTVSKDETSQTSEIYTVVHYIYIYTYLLIYNKSFVTRSIFVITCQAQAVIGGRSEPNQGQRKRKNKNKIYI